MNTGRIPTEDEAAIRRLVGEMWDAQAFAQQHDYIAMNGMFLANRTRRPGTSSRPWRANDEWEIVAYRDAPVQKREEKERIRDREFVIDITGL